MTTGQQQTEEGKKPIAAIGLVAVLALGAVVLLVSRDDSEAEQSDSPQSAVPYICTDCGHVFELTPAAYEQLTKEGGVKTPADPERGGIPMLRCPECGKLAGVGACSCPKDQTVFARRQANGRPGKCPKCGWSYYVR